MDIPDLNWIDLSNLPDEVKTKILSKEPSVYSMMPYINKGIESTSKYHRLKTNCLKAITETELNIYKELYIPNSLCQLVSYSNNEGIWYVGVFLGKSFRYDNYLYGQSHVHGKYIEDDYIGIDDQLEGSVIHMDTNATVYHDNSKLYNNAIVHGYDLVTTYYVLKSRESCMKFNKGFAKRVVIDTLEDMNNKYTDFIEDYVEKYKEKEIIIDDETIWVVWNNIFGPLYDYYTYLKCNAMIMGINIITGKHLAINPSIEDVMKFNKTIMDFIEEYYPRVRIYLENIDDTEFIDQEYRYVLNNI
jgi:hypothetical protein